MSSFYLFISLSITIVKNNIFDIIQPYTRKKLNDIYIYRNEDGGKIKNVWPCLYYILGLQLEVFIGFFPFGQRFN